MATKREIDVPNQVITIEFTNGQIIGPIEFNPTTDALTKMIAVLEGRIVDLEAKIATTNMAAILISGQ
jgi:hypothetical protein